jgi:hypothetical protein
MTQEQALAALDHEHVGVPVVHASIGADERTAAAAEQLQESRGTPQEHRATVSTAQRSAPQAFREFLDDGGDRREGCVAGKVIFAVAGLKVGMHLGRVAVGSGSVGALECAL